MFDKLIEIAVAFSLNEAAQKSQGASLLISRFKRQANRALKVSYLTCFLKELMSLWLLTH